MVFTDWSETRNPAWAKETPNHNNLVIAGAVLDVDAFAAGLDDADDVVVTTTAEAVATATTIAVSALSGAIPSGTVLNFGSGLFAELSAAAAEAATSLTVVALAATIPDASTATYAGESAGTDGPVTIPSGTLVMRLLTDRDDGPFVPFGDAYDAGTHEAYLTYHGIYNATWDDEVTLYRHERVVAYNKLPDADDSAVMAVVEALYQTVHAAE